MGSQSMLHQYVRNFLIGNHGLCNLLPDKLYLSMLYKMKIGKRLNWESPQGFNEKIQWLKLYNRDPRITMLVDKIAVRKHIAAEIGEQYLVPLLGVWESIDDVDFDVLPDEFVLKCSHDSGSSIVVSSKDEFDLAYARTFYRMRLQQNFFWPWREWPYRDVPPMLMAEARLHGEQGKDINDYKFMCFHGRCRCIFVCSDRRDDEGLKVTFFDREWRKLPFERHYPSSNASIAAPHNLREMIDLAERLSADFPFVRVDFYEVSSRIYFGELTFFPGAGFEEFDPYEADIELGSWIDLKEVG